MRRIYVGNLSSRATKRDIARFFHRYGPLEDILMRDGFGFVQLNNSADAEDAIDRLNGRELCGGRVTLELARAERRGGRDRYGPPTRTRHRLVVKNLGSDVKWQDLKDLVRRAGEVTFADVHRPVRGEGIVEFESKDDMRRAMKQYEGYEWHGRRLRLVADGAEESGKESSRRSRRSRSRSKSRSRSRSRSRRSRSRSRSRRSKSLSKSKSRSRSRSPQNNSGAKAKARSASRSRSRSKSKSASRSASRSVSRSRSASPAGRRDGNGGGADRSRSRSR